MSEVIDLPLIARTFEAAANETQCNIDRGCCGTRKEQKQREVNAVRECITTLRQSETNHEQALVAITAACQVFNS